MNGMDDIFLIDPITYGKHQALQINVITSLDIQSRIYIARKKMFPV